MSYKNQRKVRDIAVFTAVALAVVAGLGAAVWLSLPFFVLLWNYGVQLLFWLGVVFFLRKMEGSVGEARRQLIELINRLMGVNQRQAEVDPDVEMVQKWRVENPYAELAVLDAKQLRQLKQRPRQDELDALQAENQRLKEIEARWEALKVALGQPEQIEAALMLLAAVKVATKPKAEG